MSSSLTLAKAYQRAGLHLPADLARKLEAEGLSLSRSNTESNSISGDIAELKDTDRHPALAPDVHIAIPSPDGGGKGPLPGDANREGIGVPTTPQQHTQPAAPVRVSSVTGASSLEGLPAAAAGELPPAADIAPAVTEGSSTSVPPTALDAPAATGGTRAPTPARPPATGSDAVGAFAAPAATAADSMPAADRPPATTNVTANGGSPEHNPAVSPMVAPRQPPPSALVQAMPLRTYLKRAADQVRALKAVISKQQEAWTRQLDTVEKQALLQTACQVLSQACGAVADQVAALAEQLEGSRSTLTIDPAAVQLLDTATFTEIRSLWDFGDLWSRMGPVVTGLLTQLPPSCNTAQNSAILAAEGLATAGDTFKDLLTLSTPVDTTSLAALKMAALKRMNDKDLTAEDKDMIALKGLSDKANAYAKMNWRYYRAYTGWGVLLTWLKLLSALAITVIGGKAASSPDPGHWLATAMAALGALHTLLVTIETRWPPKALAKPFMIAEKQYQRLIRDISDPTQGLIAQAVLVKQDADPDLDVDPFTGAAGAAAGVPLGISARLKAGLLVFAQLRKACPDVGLSEDGTPMPEGKQVQIFLDIGMALNTFGWIFSFVEKEVPPPKDLPLWRLPPQA